MSKPNRIVVATTAGAILLGGIAAVLLAGGFLTPRPAAGGGPGGDEQQGLDPQGEEQDRTQFASGRAGAEDKAVPFDAKRAMGYLEAVCAIGPRMSGTDGMRKQQELIRKHFKDLGVAVEDQTFSGKQVSRKNPVDMTNLIVSWHPDRKRRVILCAHYDTRPIADQEKDPRKLREPFVSANDGGSGVAFLMELGHHMKGLKTTVGVDFVLFDGEEYIWDRDRDKYFLGSKHFAQTWRKAKGRPDYAAAVLLDMIAGKNARFPVEGHSWQRARKLVLEVWGVAGELRSPMFLDRGGDHVLDDHISLLDVGIPAIDVIDFSYPHWHKLTDTPENCSGESLAEVARVLTTWLQRTR